MTDLRVYDHISGAVGWTPLVRLRRAVEGLAAEVFAKIEFMNPMGSAKDRIARFMIEKALREGRLRSGDVVVENSSGNTAMGLAMMAAREGLTCRMVVRRQTSQEKLDCLRALGVELILVDGALPPDDPESYNRKARQVVARTPRAFFPDQHNNRANNEAHYRGTGPEIWKQMEERIDVLVAGIGTGGTICGVARYLKEQDRRIRVIAVDPVGSVFHDYFRTGRPGTSRPSLLEGLGDEEIIGCPEFELIDDMLQVSDRDAFLAARDLARLEAILAGGSSGAALWGVRTIASRLDRPARIVTVFPDSGSRYLSTIYNDDWMRRHGFLDEAR
ncbi:MAG TPA: cysteine synthase family protein [Candidatus Polarisedimenticolia bacterium]|nr:cysteine synthase family protein [Candidatus Polarisedimenticolia bacterium]